jgi:hypothetical protein
MRMRKIGLISLALAASLLPSTMFAGRLDGDFRTQQDGAAPDTNDACTVVDGVVFFVNGRVTGISGGCTAEIDYFTPEPHKASATALKGTKTEGSGKVDQSIFTDVDIDVFDTDGGGPGVCTTTFFGSINEDVEKCKASSSIKGTSVSGGDDTVQSSNVSVACELGVAGANVDTSEAAGVQPPTQAQIDVVVAAFDGRKDVKIENKGKLTIKQKGVPDTTPGTPGCD